MERERTNREKVFLLIKVIVKYPSQRSLIKKKFYSKKNVLERTSLNKSERNKSVFLSK